MNENIWPIFRGKHQTSRDYRLPSFILDDMDFLDKIPKDIQENTVLVSFDLVSLYASIPHDLGLEAINYWLENYVASLSQQIPKDFILKAISIVLKENTFQFDGKNYKQVQGTAMGTKIVPTYATLVMGYLETRLYEKYGQRYGNCDKEEVIRLFKRFLDDCFLMWKKTEEELDEFQKLLNVLNPKIQFTMEKDEHMLPFLDVLLYKNRNKLECDICYKGTDTHQYLDILSCHPKHTEQNIPNNLERRICAILTNEIQKERLKELEKFPLKQNYPSTMITKGRQKAKSKKIAELRTPKEKTTINNILPSVITHNPNNLAISGRIKENIKFLNNSEKIKNISQEKPLIVYTNQKI